MKPPDYFNDKEQLLTTVLDMHEPDDCLEMTDRTVKILDAEYDKIDIPEVISKCDHLTKDQRDELQNLLIKFKDLFDGSLGDWKLDPISIDLKPDAKPYHGKSYQVPVVNKIGFKKELDRLVKLGILKKDSDSPWTVPFLVYPKRMIKSDPYLPFVN